jgi:membrane-bound serine protease (ClpP class)
MHGTVSTKLDFVVKNERLKHASTMQQRSRFVLRLPSFFQALFVLFCVLGLGNPSAARGQDSVPDHTRPRPDSFSQPVLIEFKGEINEMLASYFNRAMDRAKTAKADLIIVEVDSPGGLKIESLQMARRLRDCDWAYTVVICENEAISGGSLVSLGVDEIHLNPDAKFGDSGEIGFDAERWAWRLIEPKIESYLSRDARDLAESKGRSPDLAEAMVDSDHLVYTKPADDGENEIEFTSASSDDKLKPDPPWELVIESKTGRFLTVSGKRAVELGLAQGHESSRDAIAAELNFDLETLSVYKPTATDYIVDFLNWPMISGLLILIGLIGLYVELSAPGIGVGGLTAALCALLFFWSHFLGGTAGWLEVTLFISGLLFIAAEIFVIPGFGVAGITGLLLLFASVILASQSFIVPVTAEDWNRTFTSVAVTVIFGCGFLVAAIVITKHMGQLPIFKGFILDARSEDDLEPSEAQTSISDQPAVAVGDQGVADSLLRPAGRAKFDGRVFDVISDGSFVDAGTPVQVVKVNGNVITVSEVGVTG